MDGYLAKHDGVTIGRVYGTKFEMDGVDAEQRIRNALPDERVVVEAPDGRVTFYRMDWFKEFTKPLKPLKV